MKITVSKYLNVRVGNPNLNAPCYQYIAPGSELDVDGQLYKGDPYDGIDTWLKDAAGNYYWSGGVDKNISFESVDYTFFLKNIDSEILNKKGENVTIVIIDGGVKFDKRFFNFDKVQSINIDNNPVSSEHGTFIAGIIAGVNNVFGIASEANIVSLKYKSDNTTIKDLLKNLIASLNVIWS